jgi:hypothetical protein
MRVRNAREESERGPLCIWRLPGSVMAASKETPKSRAEAAFPHSEQRDKPVMRMIEKDRTAVDAKQSGSKLCALPRKLPSPSTEGRGDTRKAQAG